ncbi:TadE family protein [Sphingomicrobium clamense]|uniref:Pilus assembly protein n=1 Tax=Sphingomicrobium clamense TaxID=2851013 RepID=A0ABS6V3D0_9SPHN|nr:TadE family protein [Sphingomicrobium sp. B8]MBW0144060.1 pilus assembly protein [Sphingomicrobium sp. B8]
MGWHLDLWNSKRGSAAAELALSLPVFFAILFGATEAGFYFYNEHKLTESVRDGARFASRQGFSDYPCGGAMDATTQGDIIEVVRTGKVNGTEDRLPRMDEGTFNVTFTCISQMETKPGSGSHVPVGGIYTSAGEAPVVTIDAAVPYQSLFGFVYGFPSGGIWLNADQQTTVNGV